MPPYSSPEKGSVSSVIAMKFVRLGDQIITTRAGDISTSHDELAKSDGLLEPLNAAIERDNVAVDADAGLLYIWPDKIRVWDRSSTLALPIEEAARDRSIVVFQAQSEGYRVEKDF